MENDHLEVLPSSLGTFKCHFLETKCIKTCIFKNYFILFLGECFHYGKFTIYDKLKISIFLYLQYQAKQIVDLWRVFVYIETLKGQCHENFIWTETVGV